MTLVVWLKPYWINENMFRTHIKKQSQEEKLS